jgi:two-component sensor histidine kinase
MLKEACLGFEDTVAPGPPLKNLRKRSPLGVLAASGLLVLGLVLTAAVSLHNKSMIDLAARREFEFTCNEVQINIAERLKGNAQILRSGVAFFNASEQVSRNEWHEFTHSLKLELDYPGIQGVGFSVLIQPGNLERHIEEIRSEGFPAYSVRPAGERAVYSSIIYLEPFSGRNLRAFGYDMFSEPIRRAAMERARDLNEPALSGKVILVQETEHDVQFGTLMYIPVYRPGESVDTVEQRRAAILGWVYSPYRMSDLMRGTLRDWDVKLAGTQLVLQIYDGDGTGDEALMYDSRGAAGNGTESAAPSFTREVPVEYAGRHWSLRFRQFGGLAPASRYRVVWVNAAGGSVISLLLFVLVLSIRRTRGYAAQLAVRLEENRSLLGELQHRVKNSLNMICSLINLSVHDDADAQTREIFEELESRVRSVSELYSLLYTSGSVTEVWLDDYCRQVSETVVGLAGRVVLDTSLESITVPVKTAAPVGLIVNELLTNALKYAFPDDRSGTITMSLRKTGTEINLELADNGVGLPEGFDQTTAKGMGLGLVRALVDQLGGSFRMESLEPGTRCLLKFPLQSASSE